MKQCLLICKTMYILKVCSIHYTVRQNTNVKKIISGWNKRYKKCPLFSFVSSNSSQFYFAILVWAEAQWFVSLKLCVRFFNFDSVSFLLKFTFICSIKYMDSLTLKRHNSFKIKIIEKPMTVLLPDLYVSWNSLKTDLKTNFLSLENSSFENLTFSQ